jgi:tetratricopeptide (TPR) repeat protein
MRTLRLAGDVRLIYSQVLFCSVFFLFLAPASHSQSIPCLVGRGPGTNGWARTDDTPIGQQLREAALERNGTMSKLKDLYDGIVAQANQLPDTDPCKARALFYAGLFYMESGDRQKALALQKHVVAIDEAALPPDHPRLILDLRELANLEVQDDPAEAAAIYQRVLSLMQNEPRLTSIERMFTFMNVAQFYDHRKDFAQAEAFYRQALEAASQLQPTLASWSLTVRSLLAHVLQEEGNTNQADAILAEPPSQPMPAPPVPGGSRVRPDISGPLTDLARAKQFASEANLADAENLDLRAVSALEKSNDPAVKGEFESALVRLGDVYRQQHRYPEAETMLLRAFDLWVTLASEPGSKFAEFAEPIGGLAQLYKDENQSASVEPVLRRTLALQDRVLPPDNFAIGLTLNDLIRLYREQGNYEATIPLYQRELTIYEKKWGTESPLLAGILEPYAFALEKLNRPDEAAALRARLARVQKQSASSPR